MAPNYETVNNVVRQYVADVRKAMPIDKAVLFGSYAKGTATEWSDVDICFFSETFAHEQTVEIVTDLLGLARKYYKYACIEPRVFLTSDIENDNPFVKEVLRTGREIA
jgi:predicted nucleotidyltransferase